MKLMASGVTFSAAITRSPSFSRSSSSVRMTILPRRIWDSAFSTSAMLSSCFLHIWASAADALLRDRPYAAPQRVQPSDVFAYQIGLDIDPAYHSLGTQRRSLLGLRNDRHREAVGAQLVDRQADAVERDRALFDEHRRERAGQRKFHQPGAALLASANDVRNGIDVPQHQVAS